MYDKKTVKMAGIWFAIVPPLFIILFEIVSMYFNYPTILHEPTGRILEIYLSKMPALLVYCYLLMFVGFLFVPLSVIAHKLLDTGEKSVILQTGTITGIVAGTINVLGAFRWVWLVPNLAYLYVDPTVSQATKDAVVVTFEAFHLYAGVSIGEFFGMNLLGIWGIIIAIMLFKSTLVKKWLALIGILTAAFIVAGAFQVFGIKAAGVVVVVGANLWAVWMVITGITLVADARKM